MHEMTGDTHFKLFRVARFTERTDYVVSNNIIRQSADGAEEKGAVRWTAEQFHREEKQITSIEHCQCRSGCSRRNTIGIVVLVSMQLRCWLTRPRGPSITINKDSSMLDEGTYKVLEKGDVYKFRSETGN